MTRKQLPFKIIEHLDAKRPYYQAQYLHPSLQWITATGDTISEAIKDLKSARRDAVRADTHWKYHPEPFEGGYEYENWTYRKVIIGH